MSVDFGSTNEFNLHWSNIICIGYNFGYYYYYANCLEQIQRLESWPARASPRLQYEERLRRLGLDSLNRRRLRGDLIAACEVFFGGLDLELSLFLDHYCGRA